MGPEGQDLGLYIKEFGPDSPWNNGTQHVVRADNWVVVTVENLGSTISILPVTVTMVRLCVCDRGVKGLSCNRLCTHTTLPQLAQLICLAYLLRCAWMVSR